MLKVVQLIYRKPELQQGPDYQLPTRLQARFTSGGCRQDDLLKDADDGRYRFRLAS